MNHKDMYTISEAGRYLHIHYQTVRNYIQKGYIKPIKIGRTIRIPSSEIEKLKPKNEVQKLEIELRFKLNDKTATEDRLRKLGAKLTNHSHVIDHYYCNINITNLKEKDLYFNSPSGFAIRIREMDNDYSGKINTTLEVKKLAGPDFNDHTNCLESEIEVPNIQETHKLLTMMNQKPFVKIDKDRFVYRLGEIKFCFDSIKNWGNGLEIEKMASEDIHLVHMELMDLANQLGLTESDMPENSFTYEVIKKLAKF